MLFFSSSLYHLLTSCMYVLIGVPAVPEVVVKVLSPRSVEVVWTPPSSLLLLDHYTLTLYQVSSDRQQRPAGRSTTQSASQETRQMFEDLRPFTMYTVEVEAHNIAGNSISSGPVKFKTSEAGRHPYYRHSPITSQFIKGHCNFNNVAF